MTVRTTSSGCSSPNCHARVAPVELAGRAGVAHVVVAAAGGVELGEDPAQRGLARAGAPPCGVSSSSPPLRSGSPAAPARARAGAAAVEVVDGAAARARARAAPRRRRRARRRGSPATSADSSSSRSASSSSAVVASPRPSGCRRASARGRLQSRSGRRARSASASAPSRAARPDVLHRLRHQAGELGPLLGRQRVISRCGRGRPAGEGVDELLEVLRVVREEVAVLAP